MQLAKQIEDVMDNFDFHKVRNVMEYLEWKWTNLDDIPYNEGIPDITWIKKTARYLLTEVSNEEESVSNIATGGFLARKFLGEESEPVLELVFQLETCESCVPITEGKQLIMSIKDD